MRACGFIPHAEAAIFCVQYILVTADDAIIASAPAPLCDGKSHEVHVTISGNQTLLLVDGQSGRRDDAEVPTDLLSQSSTFIGGLPGEDTLWNASVRTKPLLKRLIVKFSHFKLSMFYIHLCRSQMFLWCPHWCRPPTAAAWTSALTATL